MNQPIDQKNTKCNLNIPYSRPKVLNTAYIQRQCISIPLSETDPRYRRSGTKVELPESPKNKSQQKEQHKFILKLKNSLFSLLTDFQNMTDEIYIRLTNFSYIIDLAFEQIGQKIQSEMKRLNRKQQHTQKYYSKKFEQIDKQAKLSKQKYEQKIKELRNQNTLLKSQLTNIFQINRQKYRKQNKQMENTEDSNQIIAKNDNFFQKIKNEHGHLQEVDSWRSQKILARDKMWNDKMESINNIKTVIAKIKGKIHDQKAQDKQQCI